MGFVLLVVFGLALVAGPMVAFLAGHPLNPVASVAMIGSGMIMTMFGGMLAVIVKGYRKTSADMALVRTGMGGLKVSRFDGFLALPVVHQVIPVSLKPVQIRFDLTEEPRAPMTSDCSKIATDVKFHLQVIPEGMAIVRAARSFGEMGVNSESVALLVEDRIVSTICRLFMSEQHDSILNDPHAFFDRIAAEARLDLECNGLTIESVTIDRIERLDKTSPYR